MARCICTRPAKYVKCTGLGLLLLATVVVWAGCRRSQTYTSPGGEKTTVTQKNGSLEITSKGKDGQEMRVGEDVALPDGFPKDVAVYPKLTVFALTKDKNGAMSVILKIADPVQQVEAFYKEKLKADGWEIENTMSVGNITMLEVRQGRTQAEPVCHQRLCANYGDARFGAEKVA